MKHEKKFRQEEQISETQSQSQSSPAIREFATPEEVLRFDAKQTVVPPGVAHRLSQTLQSEPRPPSSWWKRIFKGNL